ncbi:hypothetical protein KDA00_04370 [Candidatus Saccharibacteria bacterium]|nr:hypothetical protein [Candidatus Saccharibacteria bacterium]
MKKIAVTGTKGKTTVVNVVATALQSFDQNVLKVDTTGHFINSQRKSTLDDSKMTWRLVPSVCPGRYLWEFHKNPNLEKNGVAVLECSLGCSGPSGLGYRVHEIGIFLNVFEDHLGSSDRIKSKNDIAEAKGFVFSRIAESGYAVFNADDELVCKSLGKIKSEYKINKIACGIDLNFIDKNKHLKDGGVLVTCHGNKVTIVTNDSTNEIIDINNIPWAFKGDYLPSTMNILHSIGALYGYFNGNLPDNFSEIFESVRLDPNGGRLTLLKARNGAIILADYAHEKKSLKEISKLAKTLVQKNGKLVGVVRLAHDRTDQLIQETGREIADSFDNFIVYDKIDGLIRKPSNQHSIRFPQIVGRTSRIFADAICELNPKVERIIQEDKAIYRAAKIANPGDVVVIIVNDNIEQSLSFIKKSFEADFI